MCCRPAFLNLIMKFIYISCHSQKYTFSKHIYCSFAQISSELHILFDIPKGTLCLNTSVGSEKNSIIGKNPFQVFLSVFQKCFCYLKSFGPFLQWCLAVITFYTVLFIWTFPAIKINPPYPFVLLS